MPDAVTMPPWQAVEKQFRDGFPTLDPAFMRSWYERASELQKARAEVAERGEESTGTLALRKFTTPVRETALFLAGRGSSRAVYERAKARVLDGSAEPTHYQDVAVFEREQGNNQKASMAWDLLQAPGIAAEFAAGGGVARKVGQGVAAAVPAAGRAFGAVAGTGLRQAAVTGAATAPFVPSLYASRATQANVQAGREPLDWRGFPAAVGLGMAEMAVMGPIAAVAGRVGGAGVKGAAARVGAQAAAGPVASAAAELVTEAKDLDTGYGTVALLTQGKFGAALQKAAHDALTWAAFGVNHEFMRLFARGTREMTRAGLTPQQAADRWRRVLERNPTLTAAEARERIEGLPDGPARGPLQEAGKAVVEALSLSEQAARGHRRGVEKADRPPLPLADANDTAGLRERFPALNAGEINDALSYSQDGALRMVRHWSDVLDDVRGDPGQARKADELVSLYTLVAERRAGQAQESARQAEAERVENELSAERAARDVEPALIGPDGQVVERPHAGGPRQPVTWQERQAEDRKSVGLLRTIFGLPESPPPEPPKTATAAVLGPPESAQPARPAQPQRPPVTPDSGVAISDKVSHLPPQEPAQPAPPAQPQPAPVRTESPVARPAVEPAQKSPAAVPTPSERAGATPGAPPQDRRQALLERARRQRDEAAAELKRAFPSGKRPPGEMGRGYDDRLRLVEDAERAIADLEARLAAPAPAPAKGAGPRPIKDFTPEALLAEALAHPGLTAQERQVLVARLTPDAEGNYRSFAVVAQNAGRGGKAVSRERAHQVQTSALQKLGVQGAVEDLLARPDAAGAEQEFARRHPEEPPPDIGLVKPIIDYYAQRGQRAEVEMLRSELLNFFEESQVEAALAGVKARPPRGERLAGHHAQGRAMVERNDLRQAIAKALAPEEYADVIRAAKREAAHPEGSAEEALREALEVAARQQEAPRAAERGDAYEPPGRRTGPPTEVEPGVLFSGFPAPPWLRGLVDRLSNFLFTGPAAGAEPPVKFDTRHVLPRLQNQAEQTLIANAPRGASGRGPGKLLDGRGSADPVDQAIVTRAYNQHVGQSIAALWAQSQPAERPWLAAGPDGRVPLKNGRRGYMADVFEAELARRGSQPLLPEQREWLWKVYRPLQRDFLAMMRREGVRQFVDDNGNVVPLRDNYFPRPAVGKQGHDAPSGPGSPPGGPQRPGSKSFFQKERKYSSERAGAEGRQKVLYDPDAVSRVAKMIQGGYRAVADHRLANDPSLGARPAKDQVWLETQFVHGAPAFAGKVYPVEVAKKLQAAYGETMPEALRKAESVSQAMKGSVLAGDFSVPFVQGLPTLFASPRAWGRAVAGAVKAFADPAALSKYVSTRRESAGRFVQSGGSVGRLQDYLRGLEPGGTLTNLPVVGGLFERAGRMHGTFLDVAKLELWGAWEPLAKPNERAALAELIENMAGQSRMEAAGLSPTQLAAERTLLLAPAYYRSAPHMVATMFQRGLPGRLARRSLGQMLAGITLSSVGAMLGVGLEWDEIGERLNPASGKFLKAPVPLGDGTKVEVGFGHIFTSLARLTGEGVEYLTSDKPIDTGVQGNPFLRWLRGHAGPLPRLATDLFTGEDFLGNRQTATEAVVRSFEPLVAQQFFHGSGQAPQRAAEALAGFFGLQAFPESPNAAYHGLLRQEARKSLGKDYEALTVPEQARVVRAVEKGELPPRPEPTPGQLERAGAMDVERQRRVTKAVSGESRERLAQIGHRLPGYDATLSVDGVKVPLTDEQVARYEGLLAEEYDKAIARWDVKSLKARNRQAREDFLERSLELAKGVARGRFISGQEPASKKAVASGGLPR